jgi:hypothetical protein
MPQEVRLYIDNSVLEPIAQQDVGGRVKDLLQQHDARAFASIQNLVEAWRIPDKVKPGQIERAKLVRTLLQVARDREEDALQYRAVRAAVAQLRHHHPDWLVAQEHLRDFSKHRARRREVWAQVQRDATYVSAEMVAFDPFLRNSIGGSMRTQKKRRELRLVGGTLPVPIADPEIQTRLEPLVARLTEPEAFWRVQTAAGWWNALFEGDGGVRRDIRDWLSPYLKVGELDIEAWARFWLEEADAAALAVTRLKGLVDYFQTDRRVESGNWGDINHAGFAVGRDFFLTADRDFHETLMKVKAELGGTMASPMLVNRTAPDIHAEIKSVLGW